MIDVLQRYWRKNFDQTAVLWVANECLPAEFLAESATRALSFATDHDDVLGLGGYLERFHQKATSSRSFESSAGRLAVRNFVRESTRLPSTFLFLLDLIECIPDDFSITSNGRDRRLRTRSGALWHFEKAQLANAGLQFLEICKSAPGAWQRLGAQDLVLGDTRLS
jgi:hypothetical protein